MATDLAIKAMQNRLADYERRLAKLERYAASGRFLDYTPALGGTGWALGDGTAIGNYVRIGNVVYFWARVIFGAASTYGAAARPTISLPVTAAVSATGVAPILNASCLAAGVTYVLFPRAVGATVNDVEFYAPRTVIGAAGATVYHTITNVTATLPATWTTSDRIYVHGVYQAVE